MLVRYTNRVKRDYEPPASNKWQRGDLEILSPSFCLLCLFFSIKSTLPLKKIRNVKQERQKKLNTSKNKIRWWLFCSDFFNPILMTVQLNLLYLNNSISCFTI